MSGIGGEGWLRTEAGGASFRQGVSFDTVFMFWGDEEKTTCNQFINLDILHR